MNYTQLLTKGQICIVTVQLSLLLPKFSDKITYLSNHYDQFPISRKWNNIGVYWMLWNSLILTHRTKPEEHLRLPIKPTLQRTTSHQNRECAVQTTFLRYLCKFTSSNFTYLIHLCFLLHLFSLFLIIIPLVTFHVEKGKS